jgi:hypothetical protein
VLKLLVLAYAADPTSMGSASSSASRLQEALQKGEASKVVHNFVIACFEVHNWGL